MFMGGYDWLSKPPTDLAVHGTTVALLALVMKFCLFF